MNTEILGVLAMYAHYRSAGHSIGQVYRKSICRRTNLAGSGIRPAGSNVFFSFSGIKPEKEMNWKQHLVAFSLLIWSGFYFPCLC